MDIERRLVDFIVDTRYDDLAPEVIAATRQNILDTLGCALGGSAAAGCAEVVRLYESLGGVESSSVMVYGGKLPPQSATLLNATMAHALDFDDTHDRAVLHAGVSTVPTALATAEYVGGIGGKDLITATAVGIDVVCRMGLATKSWIGWIFTALYGYFGAAAVAGRLLGLGREQMLDALGIAYAQAAGNQQCVIDGALSKRLQPAFAASGGVMSALLAREGITGAHRIFEEKTGIFGLYQRGICDLPALTAGLGQRFEVVNLSYKPYPCCRITHSAITAALDLVRDQHIAAADIAGVAVRVSKMAYDGLCLPEETKYAPRNIVDAQFSIPYTVAAALLYGKVGIDDFTEAAIRREEVLHLMPRLRCYADEEITRRSGREITPATVTVKLAGGGEHTACVDFPKGHVKNPMSRDEFALKLADCAAHAARPLDKDTPQRLSEMVDRLEDIEDVSEIMRTLAP